MKKILLYALAIGLFGSCNSYYQVLSVQSNNTTTTGQTMVYEDAICSVQYNLWCEHGDAGFVMTNKCDRNLYVDLGQTFFVFNHFALDYFLDRTFTTRESIARKSSTQLSASKKTYYLASSPMTSFDSTLQTFAAGVAVGASTSFGSSKELGIKEKRIVCIPPKSSKRFSEYQILPKIYRQCGFYLNPNNKRSKALSFTAANSPITFKNIIAYGFTETMDEKAVIENTFFVTSIANFTSKQTTVKEKIIHNCDGTKNAFSKTVRRNRYQAPNAFYIQYGKISATY